MFLVGHYLDTTDVIYEYQLGSWKQRLKSRMLYLEGEDQIKFYKHFLLKGSIRKSLGKDSEVNILLQLQAFKGLGSTKRYLE